MASSDIGVIQQDIFDSDTDSQEQEELNTQGDASE